VGFVSRREPQLSRALLLATGRHWRRHPWQLALAVVGVALGVAVALGIDLASGSALRALESSNETLAGRATHRVVAGPEGVPQELWGELRVELRLDPVAPLILRDVALADAGGALQLLGVDPFAEGRLRPVLDIAAGNSGIDLAAFLTEPGACLLPRARAESLGLGIGDRLALRIGTRVAELPVVGLFEPRRELDRERTRHLVLVDIASAQELFDCAGRVDELGLRLDENEVERVRAALPAGVRLEPVGARAGRMQALTRGFRLNLQALSLLALFVGLFLVFNALSFAVVQRRDLVGELRLVGATRAQVFAGVAGEALLLGALGSLLGLLLGCLLAGALVEQVVRTINDLYFRLEVAGIALQPAALLRALGLGAVGTCVAALGPAREAANGSMLGVLRRSQSEDEHGRATPRKALLGVALILVAALVLTAVERSLALSYGGLLLLLLGSALTVPWIIIRASAAAERRFAPSVIGRLALSSARRSATRTAPAVAALAVALASALGVGAMIASFRASVVDWLDTTLSADVFASPPALVSARASGDLEPDVVELLARAPGVAHSNLYRGAELDSSAGRLNLVATRLSEAAYLAHRFLEGTGPGSWNDFQAGRCIVVSEPFAFRRDLGVGDRVRFDTSSGALELPIAGVFTDYGNDDGVVLMDLDTYRAAFDDAGVTSVGLELEDGRDPDSAIAWIEARLEPGQALFLASQRNLAAQSLEVFDRTFAVTAVLRHLTLGVALVALFSALMALGLERARERAVLRALGLERARLSRQVVLEALWLSLLAAAVALPLGAALAWIMAEVVNRQSFGWTLLEFRVPLGEVVLIFALALVTGALAALWPARLQARALPARALREE
jgi:putative ABC transport system permease protein